MMKKNIVLFLLSLFLFLGLFAQQTVIDDLINQGIKLHDKGDYSGAIVLYKKALLLDKRSAHANYELASSFLAAKDYSNTLKYSNYVIAAGSGYVDQAYITKGSALDFMGKPTEAIKTYKEGLKRYTKNHLLYYNLAITLFSLKEYKDTEDALQKSLKLNPSHAGSHFLLGLVMIIRKKRVQGMLAIYNYLLIEPKGKKTASALQTLEEEWKRGVKKDSEKKLAITIPDKKEADEFYTAELMLDLLESSKNNESNKGKTESELFAEITDSFFIILGDMKKDKKGFWWEFYVDYFSTLAANKHTEAFCYYIAQSKDDSYTNWVQDYLLKMEAFSEWYLKYLHKF